MGNGRGCDRKKKRGSRGGDSKKKGGRGGEESVSGEDLHIYFGRPATYKPKFAGFLSCNEFSGRATGWRPYPMKGGIRIQLEE